MSSPASSPLMQADAAAASVPEGRPDPAVEPCPYRKKFQALEVKVIGDDGEGVPDVKIEICNGPKALKGKTAADGVARFEGLTPGGYTFSPYELDQDAWDFVSADRLPDSSSQTTKEAAWQSPEPDLPEGGGVTHTIQPGEGLDSVSIANGHFPDTVWNDDGNQGLRDTRESGNVLMPGDSLFLPQIQRKFQAAYPAYSHLVKRRGVPSWIRLRLYSGFSAMGSIPYKLIIPGAKTVTGQTADDGVLAAQVPAGTTSVTLIYGQDERQIEFQVGRLAPVTETRGLRQRLRNLGFPSDSDGDQITDGDRAALRRFQEANGLSITGEVDQETRDQLFQFHDGADTPDPPSQGVYAAADPN